MLRPTESAIIFIQQLVKVWKNYVTVIDFIIQELLFHSILWRYFIQQRFS
jgi:hypothetical protein